MPTVFVWQRRHRKSDKVKSESGMEWREWRSIYCWSFFVFSQQSMEISDRVNFIFFYFVCCKICSDVHQFYLFVPSVPHSSHSPYGNQTHKTQLTLLTIVQREREREFARKKKWNKNEEKKTLMWNTEFASIFESTAAHLVNVAHSKQFVRMQKKCTWVPAHAREKKKMKHVNESTRETYDIKRCVVWNDDDEGADEEGRNRNGSKDRKEKVRRENAAFFLCCALFFPRDDDVFSRVCVCVCLTRLSVCHLRVEEGRRFKYSWPKY